MGPQNAVTLPASRVVARKILFLTLDREMPRFWAYCSPMSNTFRSLMLYTESSKPDRQSAVMMSSRSPVTFPKLPMVQSMYDFKAGASEKYCIKPIRAEAAEPIMIPRMSRLILLFSLLEAAITSSMTARAPSQEKAAVPRSNSQGTERCPILKREEPITKKATPRPPPELIPIT